MEPEILKALISRILAKLTGYCLALPHPEPIPIGISNRHVHLSSPDLEVLFGTNYQLQLQKELRQPGQFAAKETVVLAGPKGCLERVRILGPVRNQTQVEICLSDAFKLGVNPPLRESGSLKGSSAITIIGPKGTVLLQEGLIIAQRHIHMTPADAALYGVSDGMTVRVKIGGDRALIFDEVMIRVNAGFHLEFHLDTDEANAAGVGSGSTAYLLTDKLASVAGLNDHLKKSSQPTSTMENFPALVTEDMVRKAWKNKTAISIREGTPVTPLARDTSKELGVEIILHG